MSIGQALFSLVIPIKVSCCKNKCFFDLTSLFLLILALRYLFIAFILSFLAKYLLLKIIFSIFALRFKITQTFEKDILHIVCNNVALCGL